MRNLVSVLFSKAVIFICYEWKEIPSSSGEAQDADVCFALM